ncbi:putative ABC transporter permease protein YurN [Vallitalea longa]|uniref:ABC transporter permease protein YurN n=1 Tax=Vallitalea longa TaxID=2936439 RepID=A0A9W5YGJ2_9FIRM|nr:sugar ABC transporter permease [Vallitalea longa]GKX32256.1 putative ABC transporter permease protein YurN [Vallitalea longa]
MSSNGVKVKKKDIFLLLLPGILIFTFVIILPLFYSVRYSFFEWSGGLNMKFIGLENYKELIHDKDFWSSFFNNITIVTLCIIGQVGISLLLAGLLSSKLIKFSELHRTLAFIPVVLSAVVIGFLWSMIYSKDLGLLNWLLTKLGLGNLIKPWLDDPKIVMKSVSIPLIWQYIGYYLVIFMAAIQSIPKSILEVAEIDGAVGFKKLRYVTFPLIKSTISVAIMLCISGNMKVFDHIYVMTGGGPGKSSTVMAQYAYSTSFDQFKLGYGSSISVGILVISLTLVMISRKLLGGKSND